MVTCVLRYEVDPWRLEAFEEYGRRWIALVERFGGRHHGYFLPAEGASDEAYALFTFQSLAAYEDYRRRAAEDPECREAMRWAEETGCFKRYSRSFLRPLSGGSG